MDLEAMALDSGADSAAYQLGDHGKVTYFMLII